MPTKYKKKEDILNVQEVLEEIFFKYKIYKINHINK